MKYYPLFMNLEGRECLVVGAGAVAARKARSLLECGARVTMIGEKPASAIENLQSRGLKVIRRRFRKSDVKDYALIFGATSDSEVNGELSRLSRQRGVPVNIADDPGRSTFILPALYRRGDLSIAVSTAGRSPALARHIKEEIGRDRGSDYAELAALLGAERDRMIQSIPGHRRRAALWRSIIDAGVLDVLRQKGKGEAKAFIRRRIDEEAGRGGEP
jgi:precorrin-2 dehydrogenase/sirohydrochlorin ferrochelatase